MPHIILIGERDTKRYEQDIEVDVVPRVNEIVNWQTDGGLIWRVQSVTHDVKVNQVLVRVQ